LRLFAHILHILTLALTLTLGKMIGIKVWRGRDIYECVEFCVWGAHLTIVHSVDFGLGGHAGLSHCGLDIKCLSFRYESTSVLVVSMDSRHQDQMD
jgi:hypothetical protein